MNKLEYLRMQAAMRTELVAIAPNLMITHNFGGMYKAETAKKRMLSFYTAVQSHVFGRRWATQYDRPWPVAYGCREHPTTNPHYHVLARACPLLTGAIENDGSGLWLTKVPHGQLDVRAIDPGELGPIIYCTKHLTHAQTFDDMFVYNDTRKHAPA